MSNLTGGEISEINYVTLVAPVCLSLTLPAMDLKLTIMNVLSGRRTPLVSASIAQVILRPERSCSSDRRYAIEHWRDPLRYNYIFQEPYHAEYTPYITRNHALLYPENTYKQHWCIIKEKTETAPQAISTSPVENPLSPPCPSIHHDIQRCDAHNHLSCYSSSRLPHLPPPFRES